MTWSTRRRTSGPRAVLVHQLLALVVGQREPVAHVAPALRHRVEAERRLALGRELRVEPGLLHLVGHALGVLGQLGERHVGVDDVEPGGGELGLELPQPPQVGTERHERQVGLVAEHRGGHHLHVVGLGRLHRGGDGFGVGQRRELAEEVEHAQPTVGASGSGMGRGYRRPSDASTSTVTTAL